MKFRLKETRLKYKKKRPEVASALGIGVPMYSMIENGHAELRQKGRTRQIGHPAGSSKIGMVPRLPRF